MSYSELTFATTKFLEETTYNPALSLQTLQGTTTKRHNLPVEVNLESPKFPYFLDIVSIFYT